MNYDPIFDLLTANLIEHQVDFLIVSDDELEIHQDFDWSIIEGVPGIEFDYYPEIGITRVRLS